MKKIFLNKITWVQVKQSIRYMLVGGIATLINFIIFLILFNLYSVNYKVAASTGYVLSVLAGYYFNKKWTFSQTSGARFLFLKYIFVYLTTLAASILLLHILVENFHMQATWANIFTIGFSIITNFAGLKYLVFKKA